MAVKLQMFSGKKESCLAPCHNILFVVCPRLDATDGIPGTDDGVIMNL